MTPDLPWSPLRLTAEIYTQENQLKKDYLISYTLLGALLMSLPGTSRIPTTWSMPSEGFSPAPARWMNPVDSDIGDRFRVRAEGLSCCNHTTELRWLGLLHLSSLRLCFTGESKIWKTSRAVILSRAIILSRAVCKQTNMVLFVAVFFLWIIKAFHK